MANRAKNILIFGIPEPERLARVWQEKGILTPTTNERSSDDNSEEDVGEGAASLGSDESNNPGGIDEDAITMRAVREVLSFTGFPDFVPNFIRRLGTPNTDRLGRPRPVKVFLQTESDKNAVLDQWKVVQHNFRPSFGTESPTGAVVTKISMKPDQSVAEREEIARQEQDTRSRSVLVYGIPEEESLQVNSRKDQTLKIGESGPVVALDGASADSLGLVLTTKAIRQVFKFLECPLSNSANIERVGQKVEDRPRAVRVGLQSEQDRDLVIQRKKRLQKYKPPFDPPSQVGATKITISLCQTPQEREERVVQRTREIPQNIVVYNVPEESVLKRGKNKGRHHDKWDDNFNTLKAVNEILAWLEIPDLDPVTVIYRLGKPRHDDVPRPVKVLLPSEQMRDLVLESSSALDSIEPSFDPIAQTCESSRIYIKGDETPAGDNIERKESRRNENESVLLGLSETLRNPFAEDEGQLGGGSDGYIHIRIQQRNGRKTLTTVQGISSEFDLKKIVKVAKKEFACNGTVVEHPEYGEVIQLQGDQRQHISQFLKKVGLAREEQIKVHGF